MGIGEALGITRGTVVLDYKANIEDAKIKLRELTGEQKKQAQAAITALDDQVKAHERLAQKATLGIAAVGGAVALGIAGFKKYEESVRLGAATAGVSMDGLRKASRGLLTDMELMQVAAVGMNGKWKLSSAEMENVLGAARALELKGIAPLSEAAAKLGEAVKKGEVEPLKELGIAYDENLAKTDKRAAAMKALAGLSAESAKVTTTETEAIRAHGQTFRNSVDGIVTSIGQLVVALEPLLNLTGKLVGFVAESVQGWAILFDKISGDEGGWLEGEARSLGLTGANFAGSVRGFTVDSRFNDIQREFDAFMAEKARQATEGGAHDDYQRNARLAMQKADAQDQLDRRNREGKYARKRRGGGGFDLQYAEASGAANFQTSGAQQIDMLAEEIASLRSRLNFGALGTEASDALAASAERGPFGGDGRMYGLTEGKQPSVLEKMFGPPEEFDAYRTAWGTLESAVVSGFNAIVTGSGSATQAIKRIIGESVAAEGSRMLIMALREGAEAIAWLASGVPSKAAGHAKAAAMFGAGAVAAGITARALGAGGQSGAAAGAGASASGVGLGVGGGGDRTIVRNYYLGDSFGSETSRSQAARFRHAQRDGERYRREIEGGQFS